MRKVKCIATDFDFTQSHFTNAIEKGFFDIMRRRGWNDDDIREARNCVEEGGFSIDKFLEAAARLRPNSPILDAVSVRSDFNRWLEASVELYPDSRPFLEKWWGVVPIAVITAGDQIYQRQKINLVRLPYDELYVVSPPDRKIDVLADLPSRHGKPLIFLEDKPDELDMAYLCLGPENVITVLVLREDSPYNGKQPRYNHIRAHSLEEVDALIREVR